MTSARCHGRRHRPDGFTLIELMVTIAIAAILLMVAAPSFVTMQRNSELTAAANALVAGINAARGEAMKRGVNAVVVPTDAANWRNGWTVFVDTSTARNGTLDASDIVVQQQPALASYFSITASGTANESPPYMMFDPSGYAKTKTTGFGPLTLSIARNDLTGTPKDEQTRRVIVARTGRARACKPSTDTTCIEGATD
ncbi:MAG: prepilin-type N-terminal cleavage/methylation domain-containing protein [Variovorax sp.]|nr:MAG: prepilin-type N-terminal cleavage/methylation domain-containing protein [Variovorax sp.]